MTHALLRQYAALIKTYEDAVAENARLKAALDKYSEDEMLNHLAIAVAALRQIEINDDFYEAAPIASEALAQIAPKPLTDDKGRPMTYWGAGHWVEEEKK